MDEDEKIIRATFDNKIIDLRSDEKKERDEIFNVYLSEGPSGLERLKREGKIRNYKADSDGGVSVEMKGHIEKFTVEFRVGIFEDIAKESE